MYLSDLDGEVIGRFGNLGYRSGQFIEPSGVAADAMGHWLVADSRNNRVQVKSSKTIKNNLLVFQEKFGFMSLISTWLKPTPIMSDRALLVTSLIYQVKNLFF